MRPAINAPTKFTLPRTGRPPLVFTGTCLAHSDAAQGLREAAVIRNPRWYVLGVYKTRWGQYNTSYEYVTEWEGKRGREEGFAMIMRWSNLDDAVAWFDRIDPVALVAGYRDYPGFEAKQERLLRALRKRYEWCVEDLHRQLEFDPFRSF